MPVIIAILALLAPRLVMFLLWLFTTWFEGVFATILWPVLGFVFLPTTTLWYSAVYHWFGGDWGVVPLLGLVVSVLLDLSPTSYRRTQLKPARE
jgi:hypothetical protein